MQSISKSVQSKKNSLFESIAGALVAAPTSILLYVVMLNYAGDFAINSKTVTLFAIISWAMFFVHSITWRYVIRRTYGRLKIRERFSRLVRRHG